MKRKLLLWIIPAFLYTTVSSGQATTTAANSAGNEAFSKGDVSLMIASGFGVAYDYYGSYVSLPALTVALDIGIFDHAGPGNIGVGGIVGFKKAFNNHDGYDAEWTNFLIAGRATYHLTVIDNSKVDLYGAVTAGIRINDYHDSYFDDNANPYHYNSVYPVFGVMAGAKYNFTPGFGGFAELGYDFSLIRVGVSFNF